LQASLPSQLSATVRLLAFLESSPFSEAMIVAGDFSPKTAAGRSIFIVWALMGIGTMTILIAST
jgi:hypothetical protein